MRQVVLASLRTYARRYIAALVAVVIAVGFIVSINALSAAARAGAQDAVAQQYRGVGVVATDIESDQAIRRLKEAARNNPSVRASAVNWQAWLSVELPRGSQTLALGSIADDAVLRWQRLASGVFPQAPDEIAFSSSSAEKHGLTLGDTVRLEGIGPVRITGLIDDADGPLKASAYLPEKRFGSLSEFSFPIDHAFAVKTGHESKVVQTLNDVAKGTSVRTFSDYEHELMTRATEGIDVFQKLIFVFAGISLFVGALVIANTFTILLAQRSRDLALLRCIGARGNQVSRSVATEAIALGILGSFLGVLLGYLIASFGTAAIAKLSPSAPMGRPALTFTAVAVPTVLGIAVTTAASYLPARRAGRQSPLAALQPQNPVDLRNRAGAFRVTGAALLIIPGLFGLVIGSRGSLPIGMLGGMASFVGVILMTPVLVPSAIKLVGPLARSAGVPGALAHANSLRNPRRTAATSSALLIGVTLITSVVIGSASISHKVNTSLDLWNPLDLVISSGVNGLPAGLSGQLHKVEGVDQVIELSGAKARINGIRTTVLAVDDDSFNVVHDAAVLRGPTDRQIIYPMDNGGIPELHKDGNVTVKIGNQQRTLKAVGGVGFGTAPLISRSVLESMGAELAPHALWARAATDADARSVIADTAMLTQASELTLSGGLPERAEILKVLNVVLAVTIALLAIAVLIALIGVGNTLGLSVLERVRENSLLRALGLERARLRAVLAIEALLIAGVAALLGIALGTAYAWFGLKTVSHGVFESEPTLQLPWGQILAIFLVAGAAGLLACVLPARQAVRITPAAGLVAD